MKLSTPQARAKSLEDWQARWHASFKGSWTKTLIPDLQKSWVRLKASIS